MTVDVAFLCPTYRLRFHFGYDLLASFYEKGLNNQADFYFVFSNQDEANSFEYNINKIVIPNTFNIDNNKSIVTIKKFYGLSQIKDKYKYVIVLDDESLFYQNLNLLELCNNYFAKKILYGNGILQSNDKEQIENIIGNIEKNFDKYKFNKEKLYLWFNQLCIYRTDNIDEFFSIINYKERFDKYKWFEFDYYLYMYYLIIFHDFKVISIGANCICGFCENSLKISSKYIGKDYIKYKFNLLSMYMFYKIGRKIDKSNLLLIMHIDRIASLGFFEKLIYYRLLKKLYADNKVLGKNFIKNNI